MDIKALAAKIRNKVALTGAYLLLRHIATPTVRERAERALISGLREQDVIDLWGTPALIARSPSPSARRSRDERSG